jgi:hypothetical protein
MVTRTGAKYLLTPLPKKKTIIRQTKSSILYSADSDNYLQIKEVNLIQPPLLKKTNSAKQCRYTLKEVHP